MARKTLFKKRETINIYVDRELKTNFEAIVYNEGNSVSQIIRGFIKEYVASHKKKISFDK